MQQRGQARVSTIIDAIDNQTIGQLTSFALAFGVQDEVVIANASYTGTFAEIQTKLLDLDQQWIKASDSDPLIQSRLVTNTAQDFEEYRTTFPSNLELLMTDKYGGLVAASNRVTDYYQADEDWWQKAWNNGQGATYVGQPEFDESAQSYSLVIAIPIYAHSPSGLKQAIGVIRTTLDFGVIQTLISSFTVDQTGHLNLLLPAGESISHEGGQAQLVDAETLSTINEIADKNYAQVPSYKGIPISSECNSLRFGQ